MTEHRYITADRIGVKSFEDRIAAISGKPSGVQREAVCETCGRIGNMHYHHKDYSKPEKRKWLCHKCHMAEHAKIRHTQTVSTYRGKSTTTPAAEPLNAVYLFIPLTKEKRMNRSLPMRKK